MNMNLSGKDAGAVGGLSSGLYDDARGENKGEVINIVQDKDGKGNSNNNEGNAINDNIIKIYKDTKCSRIC